MSNKNKQFTMEEVAKHNQSKSVWLVIESGVYDVTAFLNQHPGGKDVIMQFAGKDATQSFLGFHSKSATELKEQFKIGHIITHKNNCGK